MLWFAGFRNAIPPVMRLYFAGSAITPACPWFLPPSVLGMLAAIAMSSFSRVGRLFSFGCPWILVTDSFLSSSQVSDCSPMTLLLCSSVI
jgi:hypothetical protein